MTSQKEAHLATVHSIQDELLQLLDGMDYCLDWKPDSSAWSAREVVYHLLDTPPGGVHRVLLGILSGQLKEYDLWADRSNMTPERLAYDAEQVRVDIGRFFRSMEEAMLLAAEADFEGRSVLVHLKTRGLDEPRTVQNLLEGLFARHWGAHLVQIRELRGALGL
jgi:hypothetical protein